MTTAHPEAPRPIHDRPPLSRLAIFIGNAIGIAGEYVLQRLIPEPAQQQREIRHD